MGGNKKTAALPSAPLIEKEIESQQKQKDRNALVDTNLVILGKGTNVVLASDDLPHLARSQPQISRQRSLRRTRPRPSHARWLTRHPRATQRRSLPPHRAPSQYQRRQHRRAQRQLGASQALSTPAVQPGSALQPHNPLPRPASQPSATPAVNPTATPAVNPTATPASPANRYAGGKSPGPLRPLLNRPRRLL